MYEPWSSRTRQVADCQTYVKTLLHLSLHSPATIIAPDTFFATQKDGRLKSVLLDHLYEEFPHVPVQQFPRRFWNDEAGEIATQDSHFPLTNTFRVEFHYRT
jgi:hypothetical protein